MATVHWVVQNSQQGLGMLGSGGLASHAGGLARRILGRPSTKNGKGELMNKPVVLTHVV